MKLWYQSSVDYSRHPSFVSALKAHFARIASAGVEVTVHGMDPDIGHGLPQPDIIRSPAVFMNTVVPLYMRNVRKAEAAGYDAFIVGTYAEPALVELRSLAGIPVVSAAESTLLTGCSIAPRIGLVTLSQLVVPFLEASIARHGLAHRVSGIHLVDQQMLETSLDAQFASPAAYIERFRAAARVAIAAGADAVIPAEGVVAAIVAVNGVTEVDEVPIVDGIGVPLLAAEMAVAMKERLGIEQSRRVAYTRPSPAALKAVFGA